MQRYIDSLSIIGMVLANFAEIKNAQTKFNSPSMQKRWQRAVVNLWILILHFLMLEYIGFDLLLTSLIANLVEINNIQTNERFNPR